MEEAIVLYPSPGMSHLVSTIELAKLILTHHPSFTITILINTLPGNPAAADPFITSVTATTPSITFHHLPTPSLPSMTSSYPFVQLLYELPRLSSPDVRSALETISQTSKLKAILIDFFCNAAFEVAASLDIPTYYFYTSGAAGLAAFFVLPTIQEMALAGSKEPHSLLNVPGLPPFPFSDYPETCFESELSEHFSGTAINMSKSRGIIANTFQALEARTLKAISDGQCTQDRPTPPIYCIGPLVATNNQTGGGHGQQDRQCLSWLNSQPSKSVVFLSFGSMGVFPAKQLREIAIGLENSGHRFLWVVRSPPEEGKTIASPSDKKPPEPNLDELLPNGFLIRTKDKGLVVKQWAPQVAVLGHDSVGGFVTHCGWNSILEAVCAGVPMVAWPLYAEQKINRVALVEEMKLALRLNESSEDGFVSAAELEGIVRELMDSESAIGKELRERVGGMRDAAVAATAENGSSRLALTKLVESWNEGTKD